MRTCSEFSTKEKMCLLWKSSKFSSFLLVSYVIHCISFFFLFFCLFWLPKSRSEFLCTIVPAELGFAVVVFSSSFFSFFLPIYSYNIIVQNFFCLLKSVWESCSVCPPKKSLQIYWFIWHRFFEEFYVLFYKILLNSV